MPAFSKASVWPVGYFRATSNWLLRARRDVGARLEVLDAEIKRIGSFRIVYETKPVDGAIVATEKRVGFEVEAGTSLERLLQAYIAGGGNPYDISMFLMPDMTWLKEQDSGEEVYVQQYPQGGIAAPQSVEPNDSAVSGGTGFENHRGGFIPLSSYYPGRQGARTDRGATDDQTVLRTMQQIRGWANQEIKERLQDIEWRIIKLADLREQLVKERDEVLVQAFGGALSCLDGAFDDDKFLRAHLVQNLIADMDALIYVSDEAGVPVGTQAHDQVGLLGFTFEDDPSEIRDPMG